jgi:hypothetical protein
MSRSRSSEIVCNGSGWGVAELDFPAPTIGVELIFGFLFLIVDATALSTARAAQIERSAAVAVDVEVRADRAARPAAASERIAIEISSQAAGGRVNMCGHLKIESGDVISYADRITPVVRCHRA